MRNNAVNNDMAECDECGRNDIVGCIGGTHYYCTWHEKEVTTMHDNDMLKDDLDQFINEELANPEFAKTYVAKLEKQISKLQKKNEELQAAQDQNEQILDNYACQCGDLMPYPEPEYECENCKTAYATKPIINNNITSLIDLLRTGEHSGWVTIYSVDAVNAALLIETQQAEMKQLQTEVEKLQTEFSAVLNDAIAMNATITAYEEARRES